MVDASTFDEAFPDSLAVMNFTVSFNDLGSSQPSISALISSSYSPLTMVSSIMLLE